MSAPNAQTPIIRQEEPVDPIPLPDPPLTDGVVVLRPWRATDLELVRLAATDPAIPRATTVPAVYTEEEGRAFIARQWGRYRDGEGLTLVITTASGTAGETVDTAVGSAVLLRRTGPHAAELGYWLVPPARGRRLAGRAVALLTDWALCAGGLLRVQAHVDPANAASLRTLTRAGFVREGLLRNHLRPGVRPDGRAGDAVVLSRVPADLAG